MAKRADIFTKVAMSMIPSSVFDMSHEKHMTFNIGELIPTIVEECIPGDNWSIQQEQKIRFVPLKSPANLRMQVKTHYFFVPNRIMWSDWEQWITGELEVMPPTMNNSSGWTAGGLWDYLGYQTASLSGGGVPKEVNVLPLAAYYMIYDEWYRAEHIIAEKSPAVNAGSNGAWVPLATAKPLKRAHMHDYFTSCLPFAQLREAVAIPLLDSDVKLKGPGNIGDGNLVKDPSTGATRTADDVIVAGTGELHVGAQGHSVIDPNGAWEVQNDLTPIENLRRAIRLQEWLERAARGGKRYIEFVKSMFNVNSSDKRFARPELIGSTSHNMIISEVLATNSQASAHPIGEMAGHGIGLTRGNRFKFYCEEHGWLMAITSVTPTTSYHQGLHKKFTRYTYLDYAWPAFANVGEQAVLNQEIYIGSETAEKLEETFGYISQYAEYKYASSSVHGDFRTSLDFWHGGRKFTAAPGLNEAFLEVGDTEYDRLFAVTGTNKVLAYIYNNLTVKRKLPKYGTPML